MSEPFNFEVLPPLRVEDFAYRYTETDWDSAKRPGAEGAAAESCGNMVLSTESENGQVYLHVSAGQVGGKMYEAERVGLLSSYYDKFMLAKFTMAADGSITEERVFQSSLPTSSDTVKYVMLASIGPNGEFYRSACYANAGSCRNWYAAAAPFYIMTLSYG